MMVNVCFLIDRLRRAGTEGQLLALLRELPRDRVQPSLALLDGTDAESRSLEPPGVPVLRLGVQKLASRRSVNAAGELRHFWREHHAQLLQAYFLDSAYFGIPLARLSGLKAVRVRNNLGHWLTPRHRLMGRFVGQLSHRSLVNCDAAAQALIAAEGGRSRVEVLANGVDLPPMPKPPDTSVRPFRVGMVANLRPVKAIDLLVEASAQLTVPSCVEIAGDGPERDRLQALIDTQNAPCRLIGPCSGVEAFWRTRDVAVLCSHAEGMSNALLEAMAAGRAIIATDVGANGELVRHECEGLLIPAGDVVALTAALTRLANEPALAAQLGRAARHRAETVFSRGAMVERFTQFFERLV